MYTLYFAGELCVCWWGWKDTKLNPRPEAPALEVCLGVSLDEGVDGANTAVGLGGVVGGGLMVGGSGLVVDRGHVVGGLRGVGGGGWGVAIGSRRGVGRTGDGKSRYGYYLK